MDAEQEASVRRSEDVNSSRYLNFHNKQMFADGLSFSGFERNPVWIQAGGGFADVSSVSGADTPNDARAVLASDFDDDGDVDLFVHSIQRERHALFRNDVHAEPKAFLKLRLRATSGNPEAIGATVRVVAGEATSAQVLARGSGFNSGQEPELVFGLGAADSGSVEVLWPGGRRESFGALGAGTRGLLVEGSGTVAPYAARPRVLPDPAPRGLLVDEGQLLAPAYAAADAQGAPAVLDLVALGDGKPLLLNFWASYCAPCVAELPYLQEVHAAGDVRVVTLSVDIASDRAKAAAILERVGAAFPQLYLTGEEGAVGGVRGTDAAGRPLSSLADLIDLERLALPTTLVVSPEGRVETVFRGRLDTGAERTPSGSGD